MIFYRNQIEHTALFIFAKIIFFYDLFAGGHLLGYMVKPFGIKEQPCPMYNKSVTLDI